VSTIQEILTKYAPDIERAIAVVLNGSPPFLSGIIRYHLGWVDQNFALTTTGRGKMFRPTLTLLVFEALTGQYRGALPLAAAIEIIHNFSLMHDDIEDNDVERRGRPTAWTIWGQPRIINAGDFFYSLAYKSLYRLEADFPPQTVFAVLRAVNTACLDLTEGQELDITYEDRTDVTRDMYDYMTAKKTGALIEAAIVTGAMLGGADEKTVAHYRNFAQSMGWAFQIRDDILGIWGDSTQTGKSTASDLRRKKKSMPITYMLGHAPEERWARLESCYTSPPPMSDEEMDFVRESLELTDAHAYAQAIAQEHREQAFSALRRIGLSNQAHHELEQLARFLVDRNY
jgi:geranylgeranyl diphosphate synthase type I